MENDFDPLMLTIKATGCQVRSEMTGILSLNDSKCHLQETVQLQIELDFQPDDIPSKLTLEDELPQGFQITSPDTIVPSENHLTLDVGITPLSCKPGDYSIRCKIESQEYGTEIFQIPQVVLTVRPPKVEIRSFSIDPSDASPGQEVTITALLGTEFEGRVRCHLNSTLIGGDTSRPQIETDLPVKKISMKKEKEVKWSYKVPMVPVLPMDFGAKISLKVEGDTRSFEFPSVLRAILEVDIEVETSKVLPEKAAIGEPVTFTALVINKGTKDLTLLASPRLIGSDDTKFQEKTIELEPGGSKTLTWSNVLDVNDLTNDIESELVYRSLDTEDKGHTPFPPFRFVSPHSHRIKWIITDSDSYSHGSKMTVSAYVLDDGLRPDEKVSIALRIQDKGGQILYEGDREIVPGDSGQEVDWDLEVPKDAKYGPYNLILDASSDDSTDQIGRYPDLLSVEPTIEIPVVVLKDPIIKTEKKIGSYLQRGEKVESYRTFHNLEIISLNTGTFLYIHNGEVLGGVSGDIHEDEVFTSHLLGAIATNEKFTRRYIERAKTSWEHAGMFWVSTLYQSLSDCKKSGDLASLKVPPYQSPNWKQYSKVLLRGSGFSRKRFFKILREASPSLARMNRGDKVSDITSMYLDRDSGARASIRPSGKPQRLSDTFDMVLKSLQRTKGPSTETMNTEEALGNWIDALRGSKSSLKDHIKANGEEQAIYIQALYSMLLLDISKEIVVSLQLLSTPEKVTPANLIRYCILSILYFSLLSEYHSLGLRQLSPRYGYHRSDSSFVAESIRTLRLISTEISHILSKWQDRTLRYGRNMVTRRALHGCRRSLPVTASPPTIEGLPGQTKEGTLTLMNKSTTPMAIDIHLVFGRKDFKLLTPVASYEDGMYHIEGFEIGPGSQIEVPLSVEIPHLASSKRYPIIVHIEPSTSPVQKEVDSRSRRGGS